MREAGEHDGENGDPQEEPEGARRGEDEGGELLPGMLRRARDELCTFQGGISVAELPRPPGSASGGAGQFLKDANGRSPWVTELQKRQREL